MLDKFNLASHLIDALQFIPEIGKDNVDRSLRIHHNSWKINFKFSSNRMQCIILTHIYLRDICTHTHPKMNDAV